MHAQLRSVQLYIRSPAAQRSTVRCRAVRCRALPCGAVPCLALRCGAMSCCAVLSFEDRAVPSITRNVVYSLLFFFICLISLGPHIFPPTQFTPILPIRTWHRQQAHSTTQGNLLCTSSSWHYQTAVRTKSWASSFCPRYML